MTGKRILLAFLSSSFSGWAEEQRFYAEKNGIPMYSLLTSIRLHANKVSE